MRLNHSGTVPNPDSASSIPQRGPVEAEELARAGDWKREELDAVGRTGSVCEPAPVRRGCHGRGRLENEAGVQCLPTQRDARALT